MTVLFFLFEELLFFKDVQESYLPSQNLILICEFFVFFYNSANNVNQEFGYCTNYFLVVEITICNMFLL